MGCSSGQLGGRASSGQTWRMRAAASSSGPLRPVDGMMWTVTSSVTAARMAASTSRACSAVVGPRLERELVRLGADPDATLVARIVVQQQHVGLAPPEGGDRVGGAVDGVAVRLEEAELPEVADGAPGGVVGDMTDGRVGDPVDGTGVGFGDDPARRR